MENLSDPQYTGFSFSQSQAKHTQLILMFWYHSYIWVYEIHAALFNGKRLSSLAITIISLFCLTIDPRPSDICNCICIFVFFWFNWECSGFLLPHFVICSKTDRRPPHKSSHAQDFIPILRDDHSWFLKKNCDVIKQHLFYSYSQSSHAQDIIPILRDDQSWFF